jgi:regulator of replication initiation timing
MKTANELAKELLMDLQDRTWAGDVLGKYTPEQVAAAGAKYTNLEIQRTQLVRDIEFKQNEINSMSTKSMIFWTKAEGGKEEAHKIASQELADMKATLVRTNKAMRDQAVIAGKEYCSAIRMAVGALTAVAVAGGVALVDKYANESKGMTALSTKYSAVREELAMGEGETYREYVGRGVAKTGTYIKGLGVTISDKYDSFNQWAKTQWSKLPNFRGADKQELKDLLEENKRLKAELETLNKKLSKDVDNSNLQNEQNQAQVNLQENINQIEEKTGDAEAGELVGEPAI